VLDVPDAVRVPVSAVFPLPRPVDAPGEPRWAAFVPRDGRARRVELDVGARNGVHAWVRSGLAPGDAVIVYPPSGVDDGVRVRAR
jgi:HlyD family secretion protein